VNARYRHDDKQSGLFESEGLMADPWWHRRARLSWTRNALWAVVVLSWLDGPLGQAQERWQVFGHPDQFRWQADDHQLAVTWDSSRPNAYFWHALGTILTREDSFSFGFDLQLREVAVGVTPGRPFTFEVAVGLIRRDDAFSPSFQRGTGSASPNLVEFDYFPDSGFGATVSPTLVSRNGQFNTAFTFPLELENDVWYRVAQRYTAADRTLRTELRRRDEPESNIPIAPVRLSEAFTDFRLDALAVSSYSDVGADGSIRATGRIDHIWWVTPAPPPLDVTLKRLDQRVGLAFPSRAGWRYVVEISQDLRNWAAAADGLAGTGQTLEWWWPETGLPAGAAEPSIRYFRLRADRP
jgi:hypothetical protein